MTPPAQPDVKSIFGRALEIADPAGRGAYLEGACAAAPGLRAEVEDLLAMHDQAGGFMKRPLPVRSELTATADHRPSEGPGSRVGPYKLLQEIGEGGMGVVYMAEQEVPVRRKVALKIIKPGMDSKQVVARFEAERQALGMMDHPNIAKVFDAGTTDTGLPYFVMELVHGVPITEYCDANKLTPRERLELFVPVCQAIQHAHMKGIIHRDVKPSNVLVTMYDDKPVPKVIDFGVAKAVEQRLTEKTLFTQYGALVGTFEYMSPEQAEMNAFGVDTRSDVYSLGVLLYELLTGTTPLERQRLRTAAFGEVVRLIKEEEPPKPSMRISTSGTLAKVAAARKTEPGKLSGLVRGELDWIVMRCLEKDRTRRYDTAVGLARDVERHLNGDTVEACPPTLAYRLNKAYRKNRAAVRVGGAFVSLLAFGVAVASALAVRATDAERVATRNEHVATLNEQLALTAQGEALRERDNVATVNGKLERSIDLQARTRYAAEMNLLQAGYSAREMDQVRRLLLAQIPKPGEADYRGPEWHYWDRKLNGHVKEFKVPIPSPRSAISTVNAIFSSDGSRLVYVELPGEVISNDDGFTTRSNKLGFRVWDVETGQQIKHQEWDMPTVLELKDGKSNRNNTTINVSLSFKNGNRDVLLHIDRPLTSSGPPTAKDAVVVTQGWYRDVVWNTATGETRVLFAKEVTSRANITRSRPIRTQYSDDLSIRAVRDNLDDKRQVVEVTRVADDTKLFSKPRDGFGQMQLLGDGRYLLADERDGKGTQTIALWKIGGPDEPLWTRREPYTPNPNTLGGTGNRVGIVRRLPSGDGKTLMELVSDGNGVTVARYDLESGQPLGSRAVLNAAGIGPDGRTVPFTGFAGLVPAALDESPRRSRLVVAQDTGVAIRQFNTSGDAPQTLAPPNVEMLEGRPTLLATRPDGVLVTLHSSAKDSTVRFWRLPPDAAETQGHVPLEQARFSPDRKVAALMLYKMITGRASMARVRSADPQRYLVVDATGKTLLDLPCDPKGAFVVESGGDGPFVPGMVWFSADGSHLCYVLRTRLKAVPPTAAESFDEVVLRDLRAGKDSTRIRLEAGLQVAQTHVNLDVTRLLVTTKTSSDADDKQGRAPVQSARLFEFPTGQPITELKFPAGKELFDFNLVGRNWVGRYVGQTGIRDPRPYWDALTGEYLGERVREPLTAEDLKDRDTRVRRTLEERGSRVLKAVSSYRESSRVLEVWDIARQGPDDHPLFTIEDTTTLHPSLSPDGKRLLVFRQNNDPLGSGRGLNRQATLICTDTGRPLVTLSVLGGGSGSPTRPLGFWSADSQQFWTGMDYDGKLTGYDFRPRVEPKK